MQNVAGAAAMKIGLLKLCELSGFQLCLLWTKHRYCAKWKHLTLLEARHSVARVMSQLGVG